MARRWRLRGTVPEEPVVHEAMIYPSPDDMGRALAWENYAVAQAVGASLRLIPESALAVGLEIDGARLRLHFHLSALAEDDLSDINDIVGDLRDLVGDDVDVSFVVEVMEAGREARIWPGGQWLWISWIFLRRVDPATRWLPVVELEGGSWFGLFEDAPWVGTVTEPIREVDPEEPTALLVCLDRDRDDVIEEIRQCEQAQGLPPDWLVVMVPLDAVPQAAVAAKSDHWASRALDWLDDRPLTPAEQALVSDLAVARWASQGTRHRARRIAGQ